MDERIRITHDEVAAASLPAPRPIGLPPTRTPRTSQLAVASLVFALLGIPLVGCLLGPVAIICGAFAMSALHDRDDLRGMRMAVAGTIVGVLEFVGWLVAIGVFLSNEAASPEAALPPPILSASQSALGIADAPPHIRRALQANLRVTCDHRTGTEVGSGVVIDGHDGKLLALTNRHVIGCASDGGKLTVTASGGSEAPATLIWQAPESIDMALIEASLTSGVDTVHFERSTPVHIGDPVFAVGNPLGYEASFVVGIVSAVRAVPAGKHTLRVFQVQAPINHGNSGGGLYTSAGKLIGLNTWTTEKAVSEGIGFAIATDVLEDLLAGTGEPWSKRLRDAWAKERP